MFDDISLINLESILKYRAAHDKACYIFIENTYNLVEVARGIASLLNVDLLIHFTGDRFTPEESELIKQAIISRKIVVIFCEHSIDYLPGLAKMWGRHLEAPRNSFSRYYDFAFDHVDPDDLGALIIVQQIQDETIYPAIFYPCPAWYVVDSETKLLERLGSEKNIETKNRGEIKRMGRKLAPNLERHSVKKLFHLYELDPSGTQEISLDIILNDRSHQITWTDVRSMLWENIDRRAIDYIYKQDRFEKEKYEFALSALDYLDLHKRTNNSIYENIYEVVWRHRFLQKSNTEYLFRGQFNATWPLQSSLLRRKNDGSPLDIQTLMDRLLLTDEFLFELERIQEKLFGKVLDRNSLLAIAQHFGFATPLLDYTFSLQVAAFFATYDANKMKETDDIVGVIYYFRNYLDKDANALSDPGKFLGFSLFDLARINIGNLQVILPDIPDEDNRIKRQKGAFVTDFSQADLKSVSIDRIYFKQQKNEIFQDRPMGITGDILLAENTQLTKLAEKVKNNYKSKALYPILGETKLHEQSIIGSNGSFLWSIINESHQFFQWLSEFIKRELRDEDAIFIKSVLTDYFDRVRIQNDVGEMPYLDTTFRPVAVAIDKLAKWANVDEPKLWEIVRRELADGFAYFKERKDLDRVQEPLKANHPKERAAVICAYYLVAFEYLINVDGIKARKMIVAGLNQYHILYPWQFERLTRNSKENDQT
jgi:hypothetical protein